KRVAGSSEPSVRRSRRTSSSGTPPEKASGPWRPRPAARTDSSTGCSPSRECSCASAAVRAGVRRPEISAVAGLPVEQDGPVGTITSCRPESLNAQTPSTWLALRDAGRELTADVRVVVVRGEGRAFSAGLDLHAAQVLLPELAGLEPTEAEARIAEYQQGF